MKDAPTIIQAPAIDLPVSRSTAAEASSAHSRINIPLNLHNWHHLPQDQQDALVWFHQFILDQGYTYTEACEALGYERTTIFRVLKGTYEGNWENVVERITSFQRIAEERAQTKRGEFVETTLSRMVWAGLDYALANNCGASIEAESRMGKTVAAVAWRNAHNHGRSIYVIAPAYGGTKALLRDMASAVGVNKSQSAAQIHAGILRAFNRNRILIIDEAHRLLPGDRRSNPVNLEIIRDIHDRTGCAFALLATSRFASELRRLDYMFEQLLGRIEMPVRLPRRVQKQDVLPIMQQFVPSPSQEAMAAAVQVANEPGRLGTLVSALRVGSRIAARGKVRMVSEHFLKALAVRRQMLQGRTED